MLLGQYLNQLELRRLMDAGYVTKRPHKFLDLHILNYSPKASSIRAHEWSDTLRKCRGLIIDDYNNIVAFGLHKFFNYEDADYRDEPFYCNEKADGSLGVVFMYNEKVYVSTRGSFHSSQAEWANEFLNAHPEYVRWFEEHLEFEPWNTPHVEIIAKNNQVVVNYDYEDLVLLGTQSDERWVPASLWVNNYPGRVAPAHHFNSFAELASQEIPNAEGFVIQYDDGKMYKFKFSRYLELHRAVSNMNERAIYNKMAEGKVEDFILDLPNEFQDEAREIYQKLANEYIGTKFDIHKAYTQLNSCETKKDYALAMRANNTPAWIQAGVFAILDQNHKGLDSVILKKIKP